MPFPYTLPSRHREVHGGGARPDGACGGSPRRLSRHRRRRLRRQKELEVGLMTLSDVVKEKLAEQAVSMTGKEFEGLLSWYESYVATRPVVEGMLSITDEPAVVFNAWGVAR